MSEMSEPVICDQTSWGKLRVTGGDRERFLQGMVTNDVAALAPGGWCRASILSVKGRVLAVVDVKSLAVTKKDDEVVVFSWLIWPDKKAADDAWAKMMEDPAMKDMQMPFDGQRMMWGGFSPIFES